MKLKTKLILASVFAAIAATSSVRADSVSVSDQALTIALTTKVAAPGTFEVDPETGKPTKTPAFESQVETYDNNDNLTKSVSTTATKAVTAKYGNKEILESIKDDLLDGKTSGWSIVTSAEDGSVMAVKKGQDNVALDISGTSPEIEFGTSVDTTINKYDSDGIQTSSVNTKTATSSIEGKYSLTILGFEAVGSLVQPVTAMAYYPDPTDKSNQELAYIPGAGKITGVIGEAELTDANDNPVTAIIGGTITTAAAKGTLVKD
jgi:hypothetical protein